MPLSPLRRKTMRSRPRRSRCARLVSAVLPWALAAAAAGCGVKADVPVIPPLSVPAPPERELPAVTDDVASKEPREGVPVTGGATPEEKTTQNTRPAPDPTRREPAVPTAPPAPSEPPRDARLGRPQELLEQREIEETLKNATGILNNILPGKLSEANREQLADARQFAENARKALLERRFSFAKANADKALTIAQQLAGR